MIKPISYTNQVTSIDYFSNLIKMKNLINNLLNNGQTISMPNRKL
jgi:hypothetical protein